MVSLHHNSAPHVQHSAWPTVDHRELVHVSVSVSVSVQMPRRDDAGDAGARHSDPNASTTFM